MNSLVVALLVSQNLFARTYGGTGNDGARAMIRSLDGSYMLAGYTASWGAGGSDFLVTKIDPAGAVVWTSVLGGANDEIASCICQTSDAGCAVAGSTKSAGAGGSDILVVKMDASGAPAWAWAFGGTADEGAYAIIQMTDGDYLVAGYTASFGGDGIDLLLLRLDQTGGLTSARTFGGGGLLFGYRASSSIIKTSDGGYAVAGWIEPSNGNVDMLLLKLDASGSLAWARNYGGLYFDWASSIIQTADGGYAIAGPIYHYSEMSWNPFVMKLDASGNPLWTKTLGWQYYDLATSVIQTSDGGFAVSGYTNNFTGFDNQEFLFLKLDPSGVPTIARTLGGPSPDFAYSAVQDPDGGYVLAGETGSFGAGGNDLMLLKLDANGGYADCVIDQMPSSRDTTLPNGSPSVGEDCSPTVTDPGLTVTTPGLAITDVCEPLYDRVGESGSALPGPGVTSRAVSGAVLFFSLGVAVIGIYSPDGRLVYNGCLVKGENRIPLETGVYFWRAGAYKGKAVVR